MKPETLRRYKTLHTWTGLIAGMALFIAFYAGAITVFHEAVDDWAAPAAQPMTAAMLDQAPALIEAVVAQHPEAKGMLTLHVDETDGQILKAEWEDQPTDKHHAAWLDAAGKLQVVGDERSNLAELVNQLHFTAGIPEPVGTYALGIVSLLYALALISGIVIHLPALFKDLFALRIGDNLKRLWQDAHNVIGVFSLPFHVIFAVTGVLFAFHDVIFLAMNAVIYGGKGMEILQGIFSTFMPLMPAGKPAAMLSAAELIERARQLAPAMSITDVTFHNIGDEHAFAWVFGQMPGHLAGNGGLILNAVTGEVLHNMIPGERSPNWTVLYGFFSAHFGTFGGLPVKWMYFILGLAGAFLFYSGNLLWIESRRKRRQADQARNTDLMARATIGICIGACFGISATFVAAKLLPLMTREVVFWEQIVYYAVFLGSLAWAFLRGAPKAAMELLYATALATILIPVSNALVTGQHPVASILSGRLAMAAIDITAILGALAFLLIARATRRRILRGQPNSVWTTATVYG